MQKNANPLMPGLFLFIAALQLAACSGKPEGTTKTDVLKVEVDGDGWATVTGKVVDGSGRKYDCTRKVQVQLNAVKDGKSGANVIVPAGQGLPCVPAK